jgi:hypothetical protein
MEVARFSALLERSKMDWDMILGGERHKAAVLKGTAVRSGGAGAGECPRRLGRVRELP